MNALQDEGDATMGTKNLVVNSVTIPVVWNQFGLDLEGAVGGMENVLVAAAVAQASDVTGAAALVGKRCTVDGEPWRIEDVQVGDVCVTFNLTQNS